VVQKTLKTGDRTIAESRCRIELGKLEEQWSGLRARHINGYNDATNIERLEANVAGAVSVVKAGTMPSDDAREGFEASYEALLDTFDDDASVTVEELKVIHEGYERINRAAEPSVTDASTKYLTYTSAHLATGAHSQTEAAIAQFIEHLGSDLPLSMVTSKHARDYRDWLLSVGKKGKPLATSTVRVRLTQLGTWMSWCIDEELLAGANAFDRVKRRIKTTTTGQQTRNIWSSEAVTHVVQSLKDEGHTVAADAVLIMAHTGLRVEELARLTSNDVERVGEYTVLNVRKAKTLSGIRHLPVPKAIAPLIRRLAGSEGYLLKYASTSIRRGMWISDKVSIRTKKLGYAGLVCHSLRNTLVSRMMSLQIETYIQDRIMGHSSVGIGPRVYGNQANLDDAMALALNAVSYGTSDHISTTTAQP
jgi:integrase